MKRLWYAGFLLIAASCFVYSLPQAASASASQKLLPSLSAAYAPTAATDDKTLFESNCTKCHKVERVQNYKGKDSWKTVVTRMIKNNGAKITEDVATQIVSYLDKTYPKK